MKQENRDPVFPLAVFPEKIRSVIESARSESNYPVSYIASAMLFAVSVAIGNCRTLVVNASWKVKAILFMSLLGSPGSSKTHPIRFAVAPFLKLDSISLRKYRDELAQWRSTPAESRGRKPRARQLRVQDITMEAVTKILDETPRGIFVFMDELKGWISSFNKYRSGGGDLEQWLSIWSGVPITVNRKGDDDVNFIAEPYVGVIGGLQPGLLPKLFGGENMDNGFFYRLLFVHNSSEGEPLLWKDADLPSGCESVWEDIIYSILSSGGYFGEEDICRDYSFSADAWEYVMDWQNGIETHNAREEPESVTAIFRKIQEYCLRFCLVIHSMREAAGDIPESQTIDIDTVIRATLLSEYFYNTSQMAYETVRTGGLNMEGFFRLLNGLNTTFTSSQAVEVGARMGMSRATVFRYLNVEPGDPFLRRLQRGRYEKIE